MKRRLMAVLMACVMTLSLLPISALATENSGMEFYKTAKANEDGKTYTISMEAWATGKTTTQEKPQPLDIALVLDVSGSMDDPFTGDQKKIDALKTAVYGFIDGVAAKSPDSNISIVKFAGKMTDKVGNDMYRDGGHLYNYTQIVTTLTPAKTEKDALKDAVNGLRAAGATPADYGMKKAQAALASSTSGNSKVVVMFTDGEPNHQNGFDKYVASDVINKAGELKAGGTTIYTVGVFTDQSDDINTYMSSTSSNYPNASAEVGWFGTWNVKNGGSDSGKYYKTASNAADLNNIFTTISQEISSAANAALNDTTTVVDTLSDYFTFANTPGGDVKVYTADWNGNSWNEAVEAPANVTARVDGKTVRVTGYDYAANYVHETQGQKLIIEITVVPDPTATWGPTNEYPTNQGNAAVMLSEQVIEERTSPTVHVKTYQVGYQVKGDAPDNTTYEDPKYYISGQQATVLPKPVACEKNGYSYTFDGWRLGEDEAPAVLTMTDDVTLTGTWTKAPISYNITYDLDSGALAEGEENPATYTVETETFTLKNPTRENYTFTGWTGTDLSEKTEQVTVAKGSTGNRAYKANWELTTFADAIIVTIKGNTGSKEYNGSEQSVTGYTMEITQDNAEHPYRLDYVECPAQTGAIAKGTDVGKHSMGLKAEDFKNSNPQYPNVTFIVEDGYLEITPKPATITVASMEKSFGVPDPKFTGKVEGLVGENDLGTISYSRTNTDEAVGTYEKVLDATYTANSNYTVTVVKGDFTINTATSDAVLSAEGGEWVYDGKAHAASATVSDETFTIYYKVGDGEWMTTAPSVTNVSDGLVTVSVKATREGYNDLTCDDVTLKIIPKPVTVTANDMYVFSGSPVPTYSAQVEGTINDDKITYTISCDYTEAAGAGEFFDIIPSGEAEQGNYVVTYVNGTLEVRQLPNLAFNLGQYIQKDLRIIGSRAFTGVTYSATVTPVVNNELGKAMTITVSYGSGESGLKPFVGELGFTERGSYRYEVKEIIPSGAMGYDTSVYYLTVDVGLNDDELVVDKVTKTLAGGSEDPSEGAIVFCNTYNTGTIYVPVVKPALNRDDHYAYVVGYPDGMVRPSGNITRAEAATIFFRLLTDDSRNQFWMTTNAYSDVNRGDWFNNAVSTLSNAGIISGYPDGTFRPNAPITRAEMSKIIALFAKLNKSEDRFNDIAGHWAEAYIKLAAGNGWIAGYPDGSFKPQQNITRAETMTMINRVLERVPSVESHLLPYNAMLTFPDCQSGQWFYIAVQEATNSHTYERAASEKNGDEQWIALRANRDWTQFQN